MQFASSGFADVGLGSILNVPALTDHQDLSPIIVEINGFDMRPYTRINTLKISDTLGQPVTANFQILNFEVVPGNPVRVLYFNALIFAGTIDHVNKISPDLTTVIYECDCLDWSQVLLRRKLRRNFTNMTVQAIVTSLLQNELVAEGLSIGTIDARSVVPLVDARDGKMFDVLRTVAGATGQTFFVGYDKTIQMYSSSNPAAPKLFTEANVLLDSTALKADRETYRNYQTVRVTGTPAEGADALVTSQTRFNQSQIDERAAIEGGSGLYEEVEEITHPTSNDGATIALLGIGYANLRLATSGALRQTLNCRLLGYGFRAGQIATVTLTTFGVSGTFVIQSVSVTEQNGVLLFHDVELTNSSLQQRAYEAWLSIVKAGKVTIQSPASVTNNLQTFVTPGGDTFVVPAGVTQVEVTCYGGSAGGGGAGRVTALQSVVEKGTSGTWYNNGDVDGGNGGKGGASGKAVTVLNVTAGQVLTIFVGSAGTGGANDTAVFNNGIGIGAVVTLTPADGVDGTASSVTALGVVVCQGNAGTKGKKGPTSYTRLDTFTYRLNKSNGVNGNVGSGIGDAISVGGGFVGGAKGTMSPYVSGHTGSDGRVEVRW
jgi:hypothetical protein